VLELAHTGEVSASYTRAGVRHEVVTDRDDAGRWRVLDRVGEEVRVIEVLHGHDDRRPQAAALARDYAAEEGNRRGATEPCLANPSRYRPVTAGPLRQCDHRSR
jgi:hypothetical protein